MNSTAKNPIPSKQAGNLMEILAKPPRRTKHKRKLQAHLVQEVLAHAGKGARTPEERRHAVIFIWAFPNRVYIRRAALRWAKEGFLFCKFHCREVI